MTLRINSNPAALFSLTACVHTNNGHEVWDNSDFKVEVVCYSNYTVNHVGILTAVVNTEYVIDTG